MPVHAWLRQHLLALDTLQVNVSIFQTLLILAEWQ